MADVMQQQQAMGQAATGGPPDPNKGGKKPEGHGEGDDDPSQSKLSFHLHLKTDTFLPLRRLFCHFSSP